MWTFWETITTFNNNRDRLFLFYLYLDSNPIQHQSSVFDLHPRNFTPHTSLTHRRCRHPPRLYVSGPDTWQIKNTGPWEWLILVHFQDIPRALMRVRARRPLNRSQGSCIVVVGFWRNGNRDIASRRVAQTTVQVLLNDTDNRHSARLRSGRFCHGTWYNVYETLCLHLTKTAE